MQIAPLCFFGNRVYRSTQSWLSKIFSHFHLIIYLCGNEVVVRVGLFQHGQQTLWCWDRLLEMRTLPDLKPLQDDLGPVQLFSKRLELLQRTAEREHVDILLKGVWWRCCAKKWPGVVGGEEGGCSEVNTLTWWCTTAPLPLGIWASALWSESCSSRPLDRKFHRWGFGRVPWSRSCICRNWSSSWLVSAA